MLSDLARGQVSLLDDYDKREDDGSDRDKKQCFLTAFKPIGCPLIHEEGDCSDVFMFTL